MIMVIVGCFLTVSVQSRDYVIGGDEVDHRQYLLREEDGELAIGRIDIDKTQPLTDFDLGHRETRHQVVEVEPLFCAPSKASR